MSTRVPHADGPLVRPMVRSRSADAPTPIHLAIAAIVDGHVIGSIMIIGGPGSGRTSALEFLRRRDADSDLLLADEPRAKAAMSAKGRLLIFTGTLPLFLAE